MKRLAEIQIIIFILGLHFLLDGISSVFFTQSHLQTFVSPHMMPADAIVLGAAVKVYGCAKISIGALLFVVSPSSTSVVIAVIASLYLFAFTMLFSDIKALSHDLMYFWVAVYMVVALTLTVLLADKKAQKSNSTAASLSKKQQ